MSLVGFRSKNHPQQVGRVGAKDHIDDRAATAELFDPIDAEFRFTLDVAASDANAKCARYFTRTDDGLAQSWAGERVWCNPPYSDIRPWVEKAVTASAELVVMLLPNNRCEQGWWQELIEPHRQPRGSIEVRFLRGRPRFIRFGSNHVGPNERPPFGCCLLIWRATP